MVSVYYYLGVLVQMYMAEGERTGVAPTRRPALLATILVTMILVVGVGIAPSRVLQAATAAFASLR